MAPSMSPELEATDPRPTKASADSGASSAARMVRRPGACRGLRGAPQDRPAPRRGGGGGLGLLRPLAAGMLIANLLMAVITVDWKNGFRNADRGFKIPSHWSAGLLRSGWSGLGFTQSVLTI